MYTGEYEQHGEHINLSWVELASSLSLSSPPVVHLVQIEVQDVSYSLHGINNTTSCICKKSYFDTINE